MSGNEVKLTNGDRWTWRVRVSAVSGRGRGGGAAGGRFWEYGVKSENSA